MTGEQSKGVKVGAVENPRIDGYELEWTENGIVLRRFMDGMVGENYSSYRKVTINLRDHSVVYEPHPDPRPIPQDVRDSIKRMVAHLAD